ncbi:MAG TPA: hypothetical protein VMJ35_07175 [Dongiaceae bacterium]|nr:hypothetical protein [Dongiaceae bacterium]
MPPAKNQNLAAPKKLSAPRFLLISILLLVPCFWHRHIEAGDLGSHVYNAWLAQLITQHKAPGLFLVQQYDNVLFDLILFYAAKLIGLPLAEKVAVSICVLVFFWALFAFARAVSGNNPWFLAPAFGMLTYGYIFHMGFLNYYLSLGLACIGLSLIWHASRIGLLLAAILAPVVLLAHPLGFLLFLGVAFYRLLHRKLSDHWKWSIPVGAVAICMAARIFVAHHKTYEVEWREAPLYTLTGASQFHVFGERYAYFTALIGTIAVLSVLLAFLASPRRSGFLRDRRLLLELYLVSFLTTVILPENLHADPTRGWVGALATRLTLVTAIFGLAFLASLPPRFWHLAAYSAVAAFFFAFIYQDTALLNCMEDNTRRLTERLPFGTRTLSTIFAPNDFRTIYLHIPDRACIGHCWLVSNYEPSTRQFRVRVTAGSPVVTASVDDSEDMQSGTYDVQEEDLPLKQIYQCDARDLTQICIRDLAEDEKNGRLGYHPVHNPFFSQNP